MISFLTTNWLWIAVIVFFVAMHRGGHGCGMHGHRHHESRESGAEHAHHTGAGRSTS